MNFIAHYFLDRNLDDSLFFAGVSTPDLVSIFDRTIRLKEKRMPLIMEHEGTQAELSFYNGVMRHFEVDRIFHTSDFFKQEVRILCDEFNQVVGERKVQRDFFVAHILFELALDKVLIHQNSTLVDDFYTHLNSRSLDEIVRLTEWVTHTPMPSYNGYLRKFIHRKYLYNYTDWEHVLFILKRIIQGVGIRDTQYLFQPAFRELVERYEAGLAERSPFRLRELYAQLVPI